MRIISLGVFRLRANLGQLDSKSGREGLCRHALTTASHHSGNFKTRSHRAMHGAAVHRSSDEVNFFVMDGVGHG